MATKLEREKLKQAYSSKRWDEKVDKMSDAQVIAVYRRLVEQKKI